MTGEDVYTFSKRSNHSLFKIRLRNGTMIVREGERLLVSIHRVRSVSFWFGSPTE